MENLNLCSKLSNLKLIKLFLYSDSFKYLPQVAGGDNTGSGIKGDICFHRLLSINAVDFAKITKEANPVFHGFTTLKVVVGIKTDKI